MNDQQLYKLGLTNKTELSTARSCIQYGQARGLSLKQLKKKLNRALRNPEKHRDDPVFAPLSTLLIRTGKSAGGTNRHQSSTGGAPYRKWGRDLDPQAIRQMEQACSLPVSIRGALMADAHVGYGLPIGGVLATDNAVIPYAVGVDIACRMKLTVLDMPAKSLRDERCEDLRRAIETETRFGVGATFIKRRNHDVMDKDWSVSPVLRRMKDRAWSQLGTSGSGNHFVEFGTMRVEREGLGLKEGEYLALLSHSGSRGTGAEVCRHYSQIFQSAQKGLPPELRHLAWMSMDKGEAQEYWQAMQLMGDYSAANHELIHDHILRHLGATSLASVENHHNFAWKEHHDGRSVIVHRKGATPAARGVLGVIPGSMASRAYIVRGLGNPDSLNSVSHGAGRVLSRSRAKRILSWGDVMKNVQEKKVKLLSAGIDEAPAVYKDIEAVMASQRDLAESLGYFMPALVKMAPAGERPED
ncbi:MAG: RtcB family protein [Candidatus Hydrogenedentes bacterium]|nr:RtcB family protein [Candidatus Hydrogenedentota bacterium]